MDTHQAIYPSRLDWPPAIDDVNGAPSDSSSIRLVSGAKNIKSLREYRHLKNLWCFNINEKALGPIGECFSLESLYIENIKTDNFKLLLDLPKLRILSLETCSEVQTLDIFENFQALTGLAIIHFKNVNNLSSLSQLKNLKELAVAGSIWTKMKVRSFSPLESLTNLEHLDLTSITAEDESLRSLGSLNSLKSLQLANYYPMTEVAWLSEKLKNANCTWFEPFNKLNIACKKCNQPNMAVLTGRRKPTICTTCDKAKLEKHVREWNEATQNAA